MNRRALALLVTLVAGAACANDSARSLLPIDLYADEVASIAKVQVTVSQGSGPVATKTLAWDAAGQAFKVGIYLPHAVDGTVSVQATALDANDGTIGTSDVAMVVIHAGKQADVLSLHLPPSTSTGADGGAPDGGSDDGATADGPDLDGASPGDGPDAAATDSVPNTERPIVPIDASPDGMGPPAFHPPENIEPTDMVNPSNEPLVAVDGKGNVLVAWGEDSQVKTRRYDAATKMWGNLQVVESMGSIDAVGLKMSASGHATVMWRQNTGDPMDAINGAWAAHSKDGGNMWTKPHQVHAGLATFGDIAFRVAANGNARAAWEETVSNSRSLWSARYDDATGIWSDVAMVKPGGDTEPRNPSLAMDAAGNGILVWEQNDDQMHTSTWSTTFAAGGPLMAPRLLDDLTTADVYGPVVAMAPDGTKGIAVWAQGATSGYDLYYSDYTPAGGFQKAVRGVVDLYYGWPQIVMDQTGTVTLAYFQPLTSRFANMVAVRRAWGKPWEPVGALETTNTATLDPGVVPIAQIGVAANGDVHVAWQRKVNATDENTYSIVTRRWASSAMGWQPEQVLFQKAKLHGNFPGVGVGEGGQAAIAFTYWDPTHSGDPNTYEVFVSLFP